MAESSGRVPEESAPLVLDEVLQEMMQDDQEEWEYEYSTTETETYYLPLELSYPEFKGTSAKMNIHSRGGYYKNWQDTHSGVDPTSRPAGGAAGAGSREAGAGGDAQIKEESSDDEARPAMVGPDEDDTGSIIDPALRSKGKEPARANIDLTQASTTREPTAEPDVTPGDDGARKEERELRDEIQILELHSDHPLISYRGRLFEGEWAEVIGTETLLARHDEQHPLPSLRRVAGGIDVLGASSSRIATREKVATARQDRQDRTDDPLAATRAAWHIHVPTPAGGKDRTGQRRQQARFLENLMALKKIKGQTDDVTVYARDGAGKDFDDTKDPDYKPRRKKAPPAAAVAAGRGRRGRLETARRGKQRAVQATPRSTPTPARWEDLEEGEGGEGEEEEEEAEAMDEDEDEDMSMG